VLLVLVKVQVQVGGILRVEVAVWAHCSLCYEEGKNGSEKGRA
jgi:hypothetical protein